MYSKFNKLLKSGSGFSLVELVVVVVIIGILVAIAVPLYQNTQQKAADEAHEYNKRIIEATKVYLAAEEMPEDDGTPEGGWKAPLVRSYLAEWPDPTPKGR